MNKDDGKIMAENERWVLRENDKGRSYWESKKIDERSWEKAEEMNERGKEVWPRKENHRKRVIHIND